MEQIPRLRLSGPPLALQIVALLVGSLVVAELVTLFMTMILPPPPRSQYGLNTIARVLEGDASGAGSRSLERLVQSGPPEPSGPGWLTPERPRHDLAQLLGRGDDDVRLYFYIPLPFAGVPHPPQVSARLVPPQPAVQEEARSERPRLASGFMYADYQVAAAGPVGGGFPGGGFPGGFPGGGFPGAGVPGAGFPGGVAPATAASPPVRIGPSTIPQTPVTAPASRTSGAPIPTTSPGAAVVRVPSTPVTAPVTPAVLVQPSARLISPSVTITEPIVPGYIPIPMPDDRTRPRVNGGTHTVSASAVPPARTLVTAPAPALASPAPEETPAPIKPPAPAPKPGLPLPAPPQAMSLFGLAPAPFVEGDFVAAVRLANGQWAVVQPQPEPFPNTWQRRLLLWFFLSFSIVAPVGLLFARRLVRPIAGFAHAAERLGRDPTAPVLALEGPAEVGRAASAFNRMQSRLRSFVDDRTAMVGAISHDLRTPLTRLRFRLEDVPDDLRAGMLAEVDEMEQMISSVLAFIRDASEPGAREKIDLRSLLEDVVEDAVFVGKPVTFEQSEQAPVEVDPLGMRRLLGNLVENAVKYGDSAKVRLFKDRLDAVAEISDNGPGLPDDELERVFQPFYRAPQARASNKHGTGLGLAVCRSIARAHGGDVHLIRGDRGLVAQLRLPLAYGATVS